MLPNLDIQRILIPDYLHLTIKHEADRGKPYMQTRTLSHGQTKFHSRITESVEDARKRENRRRITVTVPDIDELDIPRPEWLSNNSSKTSVSGVKNLINTFNEAGNEINESNNTNYHELSDDDVSDNAEQSHVRDEYFSDDEIDPNLDITVISSPEARTNLMNLAQRMIRTFCVSLSSSSGQSWTALSDCPEDTVRITTSKATEPGHPNGLILSAVSTTWLPYSHQQVFDLLRDERSRAQMEDLSNGYSLNEVAHIANGSHPGNCISLLRINVASNSSQTVEFMLQESCTDESGSIVAYTTLDVDAVQLAMNGEDPSCNIPILPLGFVIVPMNQNNSITTQDPGCLLTIGLQVLASTIPNAKLNLSSVTAIKNHICNTIHQINTSLSGASTSGCHDSSGLIGGRSSADSPSGTQKKETGSTSRESQ